jgi:hypothetical protein
MATRLPSNGLQIEMAQLAWTIASWGIELVNLANPSFEFHVIIGNGTNVLQLVKITNLQEDMQNLAKVLVHIYDPLKKKTLEPVYDSRRLDESL